EQDIVLGCYYLTYDRPSSNKEPRAFADVAEALMAFDGGNIKLQDYIRLHFRGETRTTTLGRVLFNEIFPSDFPFQEEAMTKKKLSSVMALVYQMYGQDKTAQIADALKDLGFEYATMSGLSMGMDDFSEISGMQEVMDAAGERVAEISDQ